MPTIIDRLAAAEQVRRALDEGVDVRTLSNEDYRKVRAEMIARSEHVAWRQRDAADLAKIAARFAKDA